MSARSVGSRSTAAVLWLMILLVFLPIATAHVIARHAEPDVPSGTAQDQAVPGHG